MVRAVWTAPRREGKGRFSGSCIISRSTSEECSDPSDPTMLCFCSLEFLCNHKSLSFTGRIGARYSRTSRFCILFPPRPARTMPSLLPVSTWCVCVCVCLGIGGYARDPACVYRRQEADTHVWGAYSLYLRKCCSESERPRIGGWQGAARTAGFTEHRCASRTPFLK